MDKSKPKERASASSSSSLTFDELADGLYVGRADGRWLEEDMDPIFWQFALDGPGLFLERGGEKGRDEQAANPKVRSTTRVTSLGSVGSKTQDATSRSTHDVVQGYPNHIPRVAADDAYLHKLEG